MSREEIIRAMELCWSGFGLAGCGACPYFTTGGDYIDCYNRMMTDALEELKRGASDDPGTDSD